MTTESPHILEIVPVVKPKDPYIFPSPLCLTSPNGLSQPIFENNDDQFELENSNPVKESPKKRKIGSILKKLNSKELVVNKN